MKIQWQNGGKKILGLLEGQDFSVSARETLRAVSGAGGTRTDRDVTYNITTFGGTVTEHSIDISFGPNCRKDRLDVSFNNLTPAVATIDSVSGQLTRVSDGISKVVVSVPGLGSRIVERQVLLTPSRPETITGIASFTNGSLLKHLTDQANARCSTFAPGTYEVRSSSQRWYQDKVGKSGLKSDGQPSTFPNSTSWLTQAASGFTPFSNQELLDICDGAWLNGSYRVLGGGFTHNIPANNTQIAAGTLDNLGTDYRVSYSAKPGTRNAIKVMPTDWKKYLPTLGSSVVPVWVRVTNTFFAGGVVGNDSGFSQDDCYWLIPMDWILESGQLRKPTASNRAAHCFNSPASSPSAVLHGGDSFSPVFVKIGSDAVLLGFVSTGGGAFAGVVTKGALDTLMATMQSRNGGPVVTAQAVTLSGSFTNFG